MSMREESSSYVLAMVMASRGLDRGGSQLLGMVTIRARLTLMAIRV